MDETFETVEECLNYASTPLRAMDIVKMVEKSRFSIFRELRWLSKINAVEKVVIEESTDRLVIKGYVKKDG